jgi:hypothetical protein
LGFSIRWKNPWPAAPRGAAGARAGFAFLAKNQLQRDYASFSDKAENWGRFAAAYKNCPTDRNNPTDERIKAKQIF